MYDLPQRQGAHEHEKLSTTPPNTFRRERHSMRRSLGGVGVLGASAPRDRRQPLDRASFLVLARQQHHGELEASRWPLFRRGNSMIFSIPRPARRTSSRRCRVPKLIDRAQQRHPIRDLKAMGRERAKLRPRWGFVTIQSTSSVQWKNSRPRSISHVLTWPHGRSARTKVPDPRRAPGSSLKAAAPARGRGRAGAGS